jgi:hypothetical protein
MCSWHYHGCETHFSCGMNSKVRQAFRHLTVSVKGKTLNALCLVETVTVYAFRHMTDILMVVKKLHVGPIASRKYVFTVQ